MIVSFYLGRQLTRYINFHAILFKISGSSIARIECIHMDVHIRTFSTIDIQLIIYCCKFIQFKKSSSEQA